MAPKTTARALLGYYRTVKAHRATPKIGDMLILAGICSFAFLMPLGRAFSEAGGILSLLGVIWTYAFNFRESNLARFPLWPLYALFIAYLAFKSLHTLDLDTSWYVFKTNIHKGFILFPAALECIRSRRRLYLITGLLALAGFIQGLDGIYQYIHEVDFIRGAALNGDPRLSASMGGGRVGNYMAMVVLPMLIGWVLLPRSISQKIRTVLVCLMMLPGTFLWMFAQARSGYLGLLAAIVLLGLLLNTIRIRHLCILAILVALVGFFGPERATFANALSDIRISLIWPSALEVFKNNMWLGVGNGAYPHGCEQLGIVLMWEGQVVNFPHPHNIYVQLLAETGILGTSLFALFTLGTGAWSAMFIRKGLKTGQHDYWFVTALLWASYFGGYLVTAISAHSFFRTWWLGTAMVIMGSIVGACVSAKRETECALEGCNAGSRQDAGHPETICGTTAGEHS